MNKLTPEQMQRKAVLMRARNEASIVRAFFINEVLPVVEAEFDRRLGAGEDTNLTVPSGEVLGQRFVDEFMAANRPALEA